jgi:hypothetical protein
MTPYGFQHNTTAVMARGWDTEQLDRFTTEARQLGSTILTPRRRVSTYNLPLMPRSSDEWMAGLD